MAHHVYSLPASCQPVRRADRYLSVWFHIRQRSFRSLHDRLFVCSIAIKADSLNQPDILNAIEVLHQEFDVSEAEFFRNETPSRRRHISLSALQRPAGIPSSVYLKVIPMTLTSSRYCFRIAGKGRSQYGAAITMASASELPREIKHRVSVFAFGNEPVTRTEIFLIRCGKGHVFQTNFLPGPGQPHQWFFRQFPGSGFLSHTGIDIQHRFFHVPPRQRLFAQQLGIPEIRHCIELSLYGLYHIRRNQ